MFKTRPYQQAAEDSIFREWESYRSTIAVLPTGTGKAILFARICERATGRVLILVHRNELATQAVDKIKRATGIVCGLEMAEYRAGVDRDLFEPHNKVVVATVQTLGSGGDGLGRMTKFLPEHFDIVVCDEAHHFVSPSFKRVLDYFLRNPKLKICGLTATPDRQSEEALGQVFDSVAYDYEILDAINDGWLVPIEQQMVTVESINLAGVHTTAGDLNGADLNAVMMSERNLHGIASSTIDIIGNKRGIGFASSVDHAKNLSDIFNRHKSGMSSWVCGKTNKDERKKIISDFADGRIQWLWNCGVFCLDSETEILTSSGWVGIEEMEYLHKVANWDNGKVFFKEPKFIIKRERLQDEKMVVLETKNRSIRVTEKHRMIYSKRGPEKFSLVKAGEIVGKGGLLPISGIAEPFNFKMPDHKSKKSSVIRRVQANSYMLRRDLGLSKEDSELLALKRIQERDSLKYTTPDNLTLDDCKLIGFWIGDGSRIELQSGGIEYTLVQAIRDTKICSEISRIIESCGFDYVIKKFIRSVRVWSLSRGTGFGNQKRNGVYRIEPYLKKDGTELFWSLNESQFDSLLEGFWMADGNHNDNPKPIIPNLRIGNTNWKVLNLLQAIACVRGYRCSLLKTKKVKGHHNMLYILSLTKKTSHEMTKYTMQFEPNWKREMVWCVTSDTGNIITRRRGTVTVTGNTEGFDDSGVEIISMARPTKSRSLYAQMAGRATRPHESISHKLNDCPSNAIRRSMISRSCKPSCLIIDFVGNSGKHKLMTTADILGGNYSDEAIEQAVAMARKTGNRVRIEKSIEEEEKRLEEKRQRELQEQARKANLIAKSTYSKQSVNPFDVFDIKPARPRGWDAGKVASEKMRGILRKMKLDPDKFDYAQTKQLVATQMDRWDKGLASLPQVSKLKKFGIDATNLTFEQAGKAFDYLKANHFRNGHLFRVSPQIKLPTRKPIEIDDIPY